VTKQRFTSSKWSGVRSVSLCFALVITISLLAMSCGTKTHAQPDPASTPQAESSEGQATTFEDNFDDPNLGDDWLALTRGPDESNGETQCYLPSNVGASDGYLRITSHEDKIGCRNLGGYQISSGMVQWRSLNFTYGNLQVRAREPGGKGPFPAIWLLGTNCQETNPVTADNVQQCNWPQAGSDEIDVAEFLDSNYGQVNQQIHTSGSNEGCRPTISDASREWHTYGLEWRKGLLKWTVDGEVTCVVTKGVPSTPMFLILDVAAGGAAGSVEPQSLPVTLSVDYVRLSP
jgi:beta-glucanase (GH16 family)